MSKEIELRIQVNEQNLAKAKAWLGKNAKYINEAHHIEQYLNRPEKQLLFHFTRRLSRRPRLS